MAETISQHQQGAFSTPTNGTLADASEVLSNDNTLRTSYNAHDADSGVHLQSSALGSRPAAGTAGRKWLTTDGLRVYYDNGSSWDEIAYGKLAATNTFTAANTFSAGVTCSSTVALSSGSLVLDMTGNPGTTKKEISIANTTGALRIGLESSSAGSGFANSDAYESQIQSGVGLHISGGTYVRCAVELQVAGDTGGRASHNSFTGTSDTSANSTGVGTILFKGATSRNSTGFIKIYVGTTAYYVPFFSAITG